MKKKTIFMILLVYPIMLFLTISSALSLDYWRDNNDIIWVKLNITGNNATGIKITNSSGYSENPDNVFIFYDGFETFTGWTNYNNGTINQVTNYSNRGSYSAQYNMDDNNGVYKSIGQTLISDDDLGYSLYTHILYYKDNNPMFGLINSTGYGFVAVADKDATFTIGNRIKNVTNYEPGYTIDLGGVYYDGNWESWYLYKLSLFEARQLLEIRNDTDYLGITKAYYDNYNYSIFDTIFLTTDIYAVDGIFIDDIFVTKEINETPTIINNLYNYSILNYVNYTPGEYQIRISNVGLTGNLNITEVNVPYVKSYFERDNYTTSNDIIGICNVKHADNLPMNVSYKFYRNGTLYGYGLITGTYLHNNNATKTLSNIYTKKGETWIFSCRAEDNNNYKSVFSNSTAITIQNTPPEITSININETSATKLTNALSCNATITDVDNDNITKYWKWYKNGTLFSTEQNITNSSYSKGDQLICSVIANDGTTNSSQSNSSILTIGNVAPNTGNVAIIEVTNGLNCTYSYNDYDNDSMTNVSFDWYINGTSLGINNETLSDTQYNPSDNIICSVTVSDGTTNSISNSSIYVATDTTAPTISDYSIPTSAEYSTSSDLLVNCSDDVSIASGYPYISFYDPGQTLLNYSMALVSGDQYKKEYIWGKVGIYENYTIYCMDGSGNMGRKEINMTTEVLDTQTPSGGGGSSIVTTPKNFTIYPQEQKITIRIGQSKRVEFKIINNYNDDIKVDIVLDRSKTNQEIIPYVSFDGENEIRGLVIPSGKSLEGNVKYVRINIDNVDVPIGEYMLVLNINGENHNEKAVFYITVKEDLFKEMKMFLNNEIFSIGSYEMSISTFIIVFFIISIGIYFVRVVGK